MAAAQLVGEALAADACWLATDGTATVVGSWCSPLAARSRQQSLDQLQASCGATTWPPASEPPLRRLHRQGFQNGGVLIIGRCRAQDWSPREQQDLHQAGEAAAALIAHAQLQQHLLTYQRYQELFQDLSHALHDTNTLQALMQVALTGTAQAIAVERSAIVTLKYRDPLLARREDAPRARVALVRSWLAAGAPAFGPQAADFALQDCPYCTAAWRQAPEPLVPGSLDLGRQPSPLLVPEEGFGGWLLQPLFHPAAAGARPLVLGFLVLQGRRSWAWQPAELALIASVGLQISAALVRDRALQRVQLVVDERTAQLRGSLDMQAKLYEKSRQQVEQLRQLLASKSEFLDAVSHELRTPLTAMKMAIQVLRQPNLAPERQAKYLDLLEQEWQREYGLIQDLLALQKLESNQVEIDLQRFNFKDLLTPLLVKFQEKWQDKGLALGLTYQPPELEEPQKPLPLYSDADSLRQILQELLTNAGKYSDPDTTVQVAIAQDPRQYQLQVSITNTGRGVAPEEQETIFEKFVRGQGVTSQAVPGTGLGLALVKCLVQQLNGTIEVESQGAAGDRAAATRFTLTLPPPPPSIG